MRQSFDWRDIPCAKVSSKALHSLYAGSVPAVADVVHHKNVRMAQRAHSACLLLESKKTVRVGRERLRKDFYRHFPPSLVSRAILLTHASGTQGACRSKNVYAKITGA